MRTRLQKMITTVAIGGALLGVSIGPSEAGEADGHAAPVAASDDVKARIPDTVLIDRDGKKYRFFSDLVKGKTVLMNAVYTTCPGVCPIQTSIFARVQKMLAERGDSDVHIISVSLDPVTDTPERMRDFAEKYDPAPGWYFLTGTKDDVREVLQAMDLYSAEPASHTPIAAVGHEPGQVWMKMINVTSPAEIVSRLEYVEGMGRKKTDGSH